MFFIFIFIIKESSIPIFHKQLDEKWYPLTFPNIFPVTINFESPLLYFDIYFRIISLITLFIFFGYYIQHIFKNLFLRYFQQIFLFLLFSLKLGIFDIDKFNLFLINFFLFFMFIKNN